MALALTERLEDANAGKQQRIWQGRVHPTPAYHDFCTFAMLTLIISTTMEPPNIVGTNTAGTDFGKVHIWAHEMTVSSK